MPGENNIHVLLVNLSREWGGGEQWFWMVTRAMKDLPGWAPVLMVFPESPLQQRAVAAGLDTVALPLRTLSWLRPGQLWRLRAALRTHRPEILILNASHELKTAGLLAHLLGIGKIVFRRGVSYPLADHRLNRFLVRKVVYAFLANSQATFDAFSGTFPGIRQKPHLILNNAIDPAAWQVPDLQQAVPGRIGLVARLSPEKGIDRAIEAVKMLRDQGMPGSLHIIGEGPARSSLEAQVQEAELQDRVVFEGFSPSVKTLLARCEVFAFTPRYGEGTSIALLEAMALGLPCVVLDTPAMKEVVIDGETGFLVPDGDISTFADKLHLLLSDPALRTRMGLAAQKRWQTHFTLPALVHKLTSWLKTL